MLRQTPHSNRSIPATILLLPLLGALLMAPAIARAANDNEPAGPIWRVSATPDPVPTVRLSTGQTARRSLRAATTGQPVAIEAITIPEGMGVVATYEGLDLTLSAAPGAGGMGVITAHVATSDGKMQPVDIAVVLAPQPMVDMEFTPAEGQNPTRVVVAGEFNGWNNQRDAMTRGEDGVFRISLPIPPGNYTYKLVVDGEWMADPGNPVQDDSGYGNSVLKVEGVSLSTFQFAPAEGQNPRAVFVAGSFNGWNMGRDRMERGDDGIFRLALSLEPGRHTYKFVVDGEWMADPGNPVQDDSGYGNSVVEVGGALAKDFEFAMLSPAMPHSSNQGGFVALLHHGATVKEDTIRVLVNNREVPREAFRLGEGGIRVLLDVPAEQWLHENFVTIMAESSEGSRGILTAPFHMADAPRSPRDEVIYFAFTDRFNDGDPELNRPAQDERVHPLANYHGGDWDGIRLKIEEGYFQRLGVTTLWLSPVNENVQEVKQESVPPHGWYTSYHGYWPTSFTETNSQFGTMEDLQQLISTAHDHGIAVMFDFVANHVYETHPLLQEHPDWVVDRLTPDGRVNMRLFDEFPLTTWFDHFIPTLDFAGNQPLIDMMTDNAVWWLRQTGADGFRHDAVKHIPTEFWRAVTDRLVEEFHHGEGRFIYQLGETISGHDNVIEYLGPDLLTGQFDFPLYFAVEGILARGNGKLSELARSALRSQELYPPGSIMSPLLGNHDVIRFMAWADGDIPEGMPHKEIGFKQPPAVDSPLSYRKIQMAFAFLAAMPGPPTIYYGDEIGLTGAHDPDNRRPMPWDWNEQQQATFDVVSELNRARLESVALRRGRLEVLHSGDERLVLARIAPEETVLIVLARVPPTNSYSVIYPEYWGSPTLEPMVESHGVRVMGMRRSVEIYDHAYSFGIYRVNW